MELQNLFLSVRRWLWLVLLGLVGGSLSSLYALSALGYVPTYEAYAVVGVGAQSFETDRALESLVPTYVALATMQPVTQAVIEELALPMAPQKLAEKIEVQVIGTTRFIRITAAASDADQAAGIANAVANQLVERTPARFRGMVQVVEIATPPGAPSLRPYIAVLVAALLGLLAALGFVFVFEYVHETIQTGEQVMDLGLPLLGTIRHARPWLYRLLRRPVDRLDPALMSHPVWWMIWQGCRQIQDEKGVQTPATCILISSPGRAEGKTMTAIGTAAAASKMGVNTALLEMHLERPALGARLGMAGSSVDVLLCGDDPRLDLVPVEAVDSGHLSLWAADRAVEGSSVPLSYARLQCTLDDLSRRFELLVVDGPPVYSPLTMALMAHTRAHPASTDVHPGTVGVVLVVRANRTRLRDLKEALRVIELVGGQVLGVVLNEG